MNTRVQLTYKIRLILVAMILCLPRYGHCDTFTWTGGSPFIVGIANNWNNPLNWQGGLIPPNDGTADVIMPDTPRDNPVVNMPWSIHSITFEGPGNYSLNGNPLTLNDITHNGTGTATFNNSVGVLGTGAVWNAANGPIVINGAITGSTALNIMATEGVTFAGSAANTLSAGVNLTAGTLILSKSPTVNAIVGILNVNAATVRWDASDQLSNNATSQLSLNNGAVADLDGHNESVPQLNLAGNSLVVSTGGQLTVPIQIGLQDSSAIDMGDGQLRITTLVRSGNSASTSRIDAGLVTLGDMQTIFSVADSPATVELEINAPIAGGLAANSLSKSGAGALRLTAAGTYQAGTTISLGTLIVDNATGSGTGTGTVNMQSSTRLTGDGAVSGMVTVSGGASISPAGSTGFPIGSLSVGTISLSNSSEFEVQFNHALPVPLRRDVLTVVGNASINGNLILENLNANVLPDAATTYTILSSAALSGSFDNVPNGARLDTIEGSGSFAVNYGPASAFNPNQVVLSDFETSVVPGDVNGDGVVDLLDVEPFVDVLTGGPFNPAADVNQDGIVSLLDVEPFVELLVGG